MGENATTEISVVRFTGFHPTQHQLEDGNDCADNLLFSNCLRIAVIITLNTLTDNKMGTSRTCSREVQLKPETRITCGPIGEEAGGYLDRN